MRFVHSNPDEADEPVLAGQVQQVAGQFFQQVEAALFDMLDHALGDRLVIERILDPVAAHGGIGVIVNLGIDHDVLLLGALLRIEPHVGAQAQVLDVNTGRRKADRAFRLDRLS